MGWARWAASEDEDLVQGEGAWVGPGGPRPRIWTRCREKARGLGQVGRARG